MKYCKTCVTPDTRPRITFNEEGVCNACLNKDRKDKINWSDREDEFHDVVRSLRSLGCEYDLVVPFSGGKDSSAIAWKLKHNYGLNPLLATFHPLIPSAVAWHNREEVIHKGGFDQVMVRPNQKVSRHLSRRFFIERGNPEVHRNAGINAVPVRVAVNYQIPLVMYAEHGESEYGGRVLSEEHTRTRDFAEVIEHQIGDDPRNWTDEVVEERDLAPYLYPELDQITSVGVTSFYFSYFFRWSILENWEYLQTKIDFHTDPDGRTPGTFTNYDSLDDHIDTLYYYMQYIKFGFGRSTRMASRLIQNGQLSRKTAVALVRKHDHEFPHTHHKDHLDYLGMSAEEFTETVDKHRDPGIWEKTEKGEWKHKHPIF